MSPSAKSLHGPSYNVGMNGDPTVTMEALSQTHENQRDQYFEIKILLYNHHPMRKEIAQSLAKPIQWI